MQESYIYKGGAKSNTSNYRPIPLTSVLIKIFERIVSKQLIKFLTYDNLFSPEQHGFRSRRSCFSALLDTFDKMLLIFLTIPHQHVLI